MTKDVDWSKYFNFDQTKVKVIQDRFGAKKIFAMGLMPLAGWQMSIITLLLPIMLIAIANDYGIHMMAKYQEYNMPGNTSSIGTMAKGIYTSLKSPILLTGITTIAGILCMLSHKMIPAKQLGIVAAARIGFALLLSLLFIPAL